MPKLTDTQLVILSAAAQRGDRSALPLPASLKLAPGPTASVLKRLVGKGFIEVVLSQPGLPVWRQVGDERRSLLITNAGLKALGIEEDVPDRSGGTVNAQGVSKQKRASKSDRASTPPRSGSKLDQMLNLLRKKDGATIAQMTAATGWRAHTVRAAMTGLRKRGYAIERRKSPKGETIYICAGAQR